MRYARVLAMTGALIFLAACASVYTGVTTITSVVDAGMRDWAQQSVAGQTSPAIDAEVIKAHDKYRASCAVAQAALISYKASGEAEDYVKALQAVRAAADLLFDFITPLLTPKEAAQLRADLQKARTL